MPMKQRHREKLPSDAPIWAQRINNCLIESGMTQKELAEKADVSEATIAGWLSMGKNTEPKAIGLMKVAKALNTTTDHLLGSAKSRFTLPAHVALSKVLGFSDIAISNLDISNHDIVDKFVSHSSFSYLTSQIIEASWFVSENKLPSNGEDDEEINLLTMTTLPETGDKIVRPYSMYLGLRHECVQTAEKIIIDVIKKVALRMEKEASKNG